MLDDLVTDLLIFKLKSFLPSLGEKPFKKEIQLIYVFQPLTGEYFMYLSEISGCR